MRTFIGARPIATFAMAASLMVTVSSCALAQQEERMITDYALAQFGEPPAIPEGAFADDLAAAVKLVFVDPLEQSVWGDEQVEALGVIKEARDPRIAWMASDLLRFMNRGVLREEMAQLAADALEFDLQGPDYWTEVTDHLIAWDIPAPPDYLTVKRAIFTNIVPGWEEIFIPGEIDWRMVSWGGVLIDDRPFNTTDDPCNCIPAADNPQAIPAEEATWLDDDDIVFGVEVNGQYRAYPRQIMEVREMVNDTLGGRDLGIPYCTLCGSAQAYFTDDVPEGVERPILRTSGLLIRSNKVMYDLNTYSVFDTFLGDAVTGPLADRGVTLKQATVITSDWGSWKAAHPETTVLAERYALGRDPDFRNGRDANGPIFPVGDVDPRLPIHEDVIGVVTASGTPVAFSRAEAFIALRSGQTIQIENVMLELDAGGIRAVGTGGEDIGSHEAFWFAWSQFYPDTVLWAG